MIGCMSPWMWGNPREYTMTTKKKIHNNHYLEDAIEKIVKKLSFE